MNARKKKHTKEVNTKTLMKPYRLSFKDNVVFLSHPSPGGVGLKRESYIIKTTSSISERLHRAKHLAHTKVKLVHEHK